MTSPAAPLPPDVQAALARGDRIAALRLLRQHTSLGLKEALQVLEYAKVPAAAAPGAPGEVAATLPARVLAALADGNTLEAIRRLRESTGLGLKQAKDVVDAARSAKGAKVAAGSGAARLGRRRLAPGEVPRSGSAWVLGLLVAALLAGVWFYRRG